jgi:8-oxo-dGTP pyrophosphatase MutT (NUDIX family)
MGSDGAPGFAGKLAGMSQPERDSPEVWKPHVTVAAIVPHEGRFLIVEETGREDAVFNQPAGHLEPGESLIDAVVRETLEETGYRFQPHGIVALYLWRPDAASDRTILRVNFWGEALDQVHEAPLDADIIATHWLSKDELRARHARLRSPLVLRAVTDFEQGLHLPLDAVFDLIGDPPVEEAVLGA